MFFKNVLVPYDESEHALSALHIAFGMVGGDPEATIHVVTVVAAGPLASPTFSSDAFDAPDNLSEELESDGVMGPALHRMRTEIQHVVDDARDDASCQIVTSAALSGSPVEGIAEYVDNHNIDLVVMGRRGLGALRGMLGSVSFGVLRSVDVPVLTVK